MSPTLPIGEPDTVQSRPNQPLGFEINPQRKPWSFAPEFYPEDFTQMKEKELNRYGDTCSGESVSIKTVKNWEFHATGVLLHGEISHFRSLTELDGKVDVLSPLTPDGGMECIVKSGELGNQTGWDPHTGQWLFKFTLDLVSTGRDEYASGQNAIVTAITQEAASN